MLTNTHNAGIMLDAPTIPCIAPKFLYFTLASVKSCPYIKSHALLLTKC